MKFRESDASAISLNDKQLLNKQKLEKLKKIETTPPYSSVTEELIKTRE